MERLGLLIVLMVVIATARSPYFYFSSRQIPTVPQFYSYNSHQAVASPVSSLGRSGPPLPCLAEGFFQHPTNCSRFYRCVDYAGTGQFFSRYEFECPFGQIFLAVGKDTCVPGDCTARPDVGGEIYPGPVTGMQSGHYLPADVPLLPVNPSIQYPLPMPPDLGSEAGHPPPQPIDVDTMPPQPEPGYFPAAVVPQPGPVYPPDGVASQPQPGYPLAGAAPQPVPDNPPVAVLPLPGPGYPSAAAAPQPVPDYPPVAVLPQPGLVYPSAGVATQPGSDYPSAGVASQPFEGHLSGGMPPLTGSGYPSASGHLQSGISQSSSSLSHECPARYVQDITYCNVYVRCPSDENRYVCTAGTVFDQSRQMCRLNDQENVCGNKTMYAAASFRASQPFFVNDVPQQQVFTYDQLSPFRTLDFTTTFDNIDNSISEGSFYQPTFDSSIGGVYMQPSNFDSAVQQPEYSPASLVYSVQPTGFYFPGYYVATQR